MPDFSLVDNFDKKHKLTGKVGNLGYTKISDFPPDRQKNIYNFMRNILKTPEDQIERDFFNNYDSQQRTNISAGRQKTAGDKSNKKLASKTYLNETLPSFRKDLELEIRKLVETETNPNIIKNKLHTKFKDIKYSQVPPGVENYNRFYDIGTRKFNFQLGKTNKRRSDTYLNQIIASEMMKSKGVNYETALAMKKFMLGKDMTPLNNRSDISPSERQLIRKFRKRFNLDSVESGVGGRERLEGRTLDSPWVEYTREFDLTIGKSVQNFKKFQSQENYLKDAISRTVDPREKAFFEKELKAIKDNKKYLVPAIKEEFPLLFKGTTINQEHKIAKVLVDEGTIPTKYLAKTTPAPSFFNAVKYQEFDKPLIDLVYEYNDAETPQKRKEVKAKIETLKKNFNDKTKVKGKGYLDSVKFTYGPKGIKATDTTPFFSKADFGSQLNQNIKHSNAYLKNTGQKSILVKGMGTPKRYNIDKLIIKPPRNFEAAVQALGCQGSKVRIKKGVGGKINTTDCYQKGLEKLRNKQITNSIDAQNMKEIAKVSTRIARTGGAAKVAAILGPAGIGLDLLFEGAVVGNEYLKGKPFEEAWGRSFLSYLGPNRQDPDELEMDRSAGDDPKAQSYVQDVRLENEFYKNFNLYKAMEENDMAYTRDEVLAQMEKTQGIYDQIANKYEDTADPKTDSLAQISKQTGSDGSMSVLNKDTNYRAFEKGQEREAALEGERSVNTTLFGIPINQMTPMKSDALRRQKITDIFEDGQLVGQKMKPEVQAQGMLNYNLLKSGAIPGIGYMAEGGLANLTRTTPPKKSLNKDSQGLASLPEYDR